MKHRPGRDERQNLALAKLIMENQQEQARQMAQKMIEDRQLKEARRKEHEANARRKAHES
jgi:hypothetical protein